MEKDSEVGEGEECCAVQLQIGNVAIVNFCALPVSVYLYVGVSVKGGRRGRCIGEEELQRRAESLEMLALELQHVQDHQRSGRYYKVPFFIHYNICIAMRHYLYDM